MPDQMIPDPGPQGPIAVELPTSAGRYVPVLPPSPSPHRSPSDPVVDLSDPCERLLHGFLGRSARFALAGAVSSWVDLDEDVRRLLPTDFASAQDQAVAALRVGAVDELPAAASAEQAAYLWIAPCVDCGAEAERACMGVPSALHVHTARVFAVLLIVLAEQPAVMDMVDDARQLATGRSDAVVPVLVDQAAATADRTFSGDLSRSGDLS